MPTLFLVLMAVLGDSCRLGHLLENLFVVRWELRNVDAEVAEDLANVPYFVIHDLEDLEYPVSRSTLELVVGGHGSSLRIEAVAQIVDVVTPHVLGALELSYELLLARRISHGDSPLLPRQNLPRIAEGFQHRPTPPANCYHLKSGYSTGWFGPSENGRLIESCTAKVKTH